MATIVAMNGDYAGWVPCVSGQLSFSLIEVTERGVSCNLPFAATLPSSPPLQRAFAACADWDARDIPLAAFARARVYWRSRMQLIVLAETAGVEVPIVAPPNPIAKIEDPVGLLKGTVWIVPPSEIKEQRRNARRLLSRTRKGIANLRRSSPGISREDTVRPPIDLMRADIVSVAANQPIVAVDFEMHRTGEIRMAIQSGPASHLAPDLQHWMCEQVFFFLKHISHRHYHHGRDEDSILPLTRVSAADDQTWRRETLWAMTRAVLSARKRGVYEGYRDSIGILAYAQAFQNVLGSIYRDTGVFKPLTIATYNFEEARASIEVKRDEETWKKETGRFIVTLGFTVALAMAALWVSAFSVKDSVCRPPPPVVSRDTLARTATGTTSGGDGATAPAPATPSEEKALSPPNSPLEKAFAKGDLHGDTTDVPSPEAGAQQQVDGSDVAADENVTPGPDLVVPGPAAPSPEQSLDGKVDTQPDQDQRQPRSPQPLATAAMVQPVCQIEMPPVAAWALESFMEKPWDWALPVIVLYLFIYYLYRRDFKALPIIGPMQAYVARLTVATGAGFGRWLAGISPRHYDLIAAYIVSFGAIVLGLGVMHFIITLYVQVFMQG